MNNKNKHQQEIILRGTYVNMAVDVDFILAMLIAEIYKYNDAGIKSLKLENKRKNISFHKLTMFEKIDVLKQGVEKYHNEIYLRHLEDFRMLDTLRSWRNLFAHQKMEFKSDTIVTFQEIHSGFKVSSTNYDVQKIWSDLLEYRSSVMSFLEILQTFIPLPVSFPKLV
jgi:hypothetical protein